MVSKYNRFEPGDIVLFDPPIERNTLFSYDIGRRVEILDVVEDDNDIIDAEANDKVIDVWYSIRFIDTDNLAERRKIIHGSCLSPID